MTSQNVEAGADHYSEMPSRGAVLSSISGHKNRRILGLLLQKVLILNASVAFAWAGNENDAADLIQHLKTIGLPIYPKDDSIIDDLYSVILDKLNEIDSDLTFMIAVIREDGKIRHFENRPDDQEWPFGSISASGTGADHFLHNFKDYSGATRPNNDKYIDSQAGDLLMLSSFMGKIIQQEWHTDETFKHLYGGGFEIIYVQRPQFGSRACIFSDGRLGFEPVRLCPYFSKFSDYIILPFEIEVITPTDIKLRRKDFFIAPKYENKVLLLSRNGSMNNTADNGSAFDRAGSMYCATAPGTRVNSEDFQDYKFFTSRIWLKILPIYVRFRDSLYLNTLTSSLDVFRFENGRIWYDEDIIKNLAINSLQRQVPEIFER